ncbi:MAG: carboxypeptidase regulatory-like domain-containing protein [Planctomycetes bacterium]|nr:carboxypeptidase regulatory-like domain-containing protein [Planctomycetota bacterium]
MLPGHATGTLHFLWVMILDDSNGSNGAEIERICGLNCVPTLAKIGDFVWRDNDCDGIQDAGEPGIEGLTVTLYKQSDLSVVATTTTDQNGYYCFTDLQPDDYAVVLTYNNVSYALATPGLGGDPALDSDFDPNTGYALVTVAAGDQRTDIDAGLCVICPGPPASIVSYPCGYDPINDPVIFVTKMIPGEPVTIGMDSNFPGATGFIFYSLGPVTPFHLAGCTFYVDVVNQATNLFLVASFFTDANGDWSLTSTDTVPIAWLGLEVIFQGRICAPNGYPGPFAPLPDFFSNAVIANIGCP